MAVIAVYSLKGGVGKTTIAVNLGWCAAHGSSRRTLLWDLDPQGAATWLLRQHKSRADAASAAFTREVKIAKLAGPSGVEGIDLIAADNSLRNLDHLLHDLAKRKRLARLAGTLENDYDRIILDCPPGMTETSAQVMRAADIIVVPIIPSPLAMRAFATVQSEIGAMGKKAGRLMPVFSMADRRRKLHAEAIAAHPDWPVIPMASAIEAMTVAHEPVGAHAPRSTAARAFSDLWRAIENQIAKADR